MTAQEIFNKVRTHLLAQGRKSMRERQGRLSSCLYRGPEGTMCAVGCLIPDDMYSNGMEEYNVINIEAEFPEAFNTIAPTDVESKFRVMFLQDLQAIHDKALVETWPGELEEFAKRYNLKVEE